MKNKMLLCAVFAIFCFGGIAQLGAKEITQGYIRLVLHENTGRFTLYGMTGDEQWVPLFSSQDPRTSFLALNIDDKIFRMGEASSFRSRIEENDNAINYYFESPTVQVRQEFAFVKTKGYQDTNGVRVAFYLKNIHSQQHLVGMRFLLDTTLGEGGKRIPFYMGELFSDDKKRITDETVLAGNNNRGYWISRGNQIALMGSIGALAGKNPDYLHIANWKRLNEVTWKTVSTKSHSFNYPPYSIGDSAVCYYYEPKPLAPNGEFAYLILLALEDNSGFEKVSVQPINPNALAGRSSLSEFMAQKREALDGEMSARESDLAFLHSNIARLNLYLEGNLEITEEELAAMELNINMLKARYGLP